MGQQMRIYLSAEEQMKLTEADLPRYNRDRDLFDDEFAYLNVTHLRHLLKKLEISNILINQVINLSS